MSKNKFVISKKLKVFGLIGFSVLISKNVVAQNTANLNNFSDELQLNTITTAVPFLLISPDSRGGSLGDAGVSTSPDANSIHWNPAKLAFIEKNSGFSLTYSPWLRNLVGDISLSYLTGYYRINRISTIGASLRYFSLGEINFTDINNQSLGTFKPNEWALDVAYAMQFSQKISFGMSLRYINSNLTSGVADTKPGRSVAADVSGYYQGDKFRLGDYDAVLRAGINISNIGAKMSYSDNAESDFLPTNLRIGPSLTIDFDDYNKITILVEANKLLVPSPPIYKVDETGTIETDVNGDPIVLSGQDPNVGIASGIFGSFNDAPGVIESFDASGNAVLEKGSVRKEEFSEISYSAGLEYWYDDQFAIRMGYFYENPLKGDRNYLTFGLGFKLSVFAFDASYLVGNAQQNPLANTFRFSLKFNFDDFSAQNEGE
jgi:hypothetical protein